MVDGKQLTIAWHVDDLKISQVATKVVDSLTKDLDREFGKETPHQGLDSWDQNDSFLNLNERTSKRWFFNPYLPENRIAHFWAILLVTFIV
jgi:hypothetical protein